MSYNTAVTVFLPLVCICGILPALASLASLTIPPFVSEQCAEPNPDLGGVLKSVAEMVSSSNPKELSHPLSCLEVKERYPNSPSGYYTLSDESGNTSIVYCNMDDLYSCPSLEQALKGIQLSLDHTTDSITSQLDDIQDATNKLNTSISNVAQRQFTKQHNEQRA